MSRLAGRLVLGCAAAAVAVAAEAIAYEASAVDRWLPDLVVGLGLVACGLAFWPRGGSRPLTAAGFAWFAANFAAAGRPLAASLGEHGAYLHRALLAQAVFSVSRIRPAPLRSRIVVAAAYAIALWPALTASDLAWLLLAIAVLIAAVLGDRETVPAAVAFAATIGVVAFVRLARLPAEEQMLLLWYEAGLLLTGVVLVYVARRPSGLTVADRVVEVAEAITARDALRRVLGDDSLEPAFLRDGVYLDECGELIGDDRLARQELTLLGATGDIALLHRPGAIVDTKVATAALRALRLTAEHSRLQHDLSDQVAQLRESQRRLVVARDRQRALLAHELRDRVEWKLERLETTLTSAVPSTEEGVSAVVRACTYLGQARESIGALSTGLQPPALARSGLAGALGELAEGSPVDVSLHVEECRFDAAVEHVIYLVSSEALANVAKHARASHVELSVSTRSDRIRLEIRDDGRGGADRTGRGVDGMRERVEELGGRLRLSSGAGWGTEIVAEIPLPNDRRDLVGLTRRLNRPIVVGRA